MAGLLGDSMDDPRTMAVFAAAQGLLGGRGLQGVANGLLSYGGQMQEAKKQAQRDEMLKQQMAAQALQMQQQQLALDEAKRQAAMQKQLEDAANASRVDKVSVALSGGGGPTLSNAAKMDSLPSFDWNGYANRVTAISPERGLQLQQMLKKEQAKIKDYKEVRMPDGSVQIVGFDEYGKPVDTGRTPFKDGDVVDMGAAKYTRDSISGKLTLLGNKTQSPDSLASNAVSWARLNFDKSQAGKGTYDAERGLMINPLNGKASPVTMEGQPIGAKPKELNDSQSKALLFGSRAQEAHDILADMLKKGVTNSGWMKRTAESVPLVGGIGAAATNWTQSDEQQQVEQAKRNFLTAILRRESGAVIGPSEMSEGDKQYFPQVGDSEAVIAQKARNRQLAITGIMAEVPGKRPLQTGAPAPRISDDPLGLFSR